MKKPDLNDPKVKVMLLGGLILVSIAIVLAILILSEPSSTDQEKKTPETNVIEFPDSDSEAVDESKKNELNNTAMSRRNNMIDEMFDDSYVEDEEGELGETIVSRTDSGSDGLKNENNGSSIYGRGRDRNRMMMEYLGSDYAGGDDGGGSPAGEELTESSPLTAQKSADERMAEHQRRVDAMMSSMEGGASPQPVVPEQEPEAEPEPVKLESAATQPKVRRSTGVSTFDDDWGSGVSTFDDGDEWVDTSEGHVFKVMFTAEQKIKSGQKVTLRLLEDMVVNGMLIPANTHLYAICSVGERLNLTVTSIEVNGRIYTLNYTAYDTDGFEGLYCPETNSTTAGRQIVQQGTQIGTGGLSSRVVRSTANQVVSVGTAIIQSIQSERSVKVTPGYTFYLVKKGV